MTKIPKNPGKIVEIYVFLGFPRDPCGPVDLQKKYSCKVFRDPDSENLKAIEHYWARMLPKESSDSASSKVDYHRGPTGVHRATGVPRKP